MSFLAKKDGLEKISKPSFFNFAGELIFLDDFAYNIEMKTKAEKKGEISNMGYQILRFDI